MQNNITDILSRLDKIFAGFPEEAYFSLVMEAGKLKRHIKAEGSNHSKIALMAEIPRVEAWMRALPIAGPCAGDWSFSGGKTRGFNSSKYTREYRCRIMNFDISRPASRRLKTASEMISGAYNRLCEVEDNANVQGQPPLVWQVSGKQRETRILKARSAREAAWCYAALYVRDRKEVRAWRDTVEEILKVTRVYPETDWRKPRP